MWYKRMRITPRILPMLLIGLLPCAKLHAFVVYSNVLSSMPELQSHAARISEWAKDVKEFAETTAFYFNALQNGNILINIFGGDILDAFNDVKEAISSVKELKSTIENWKFEGLSLDVELKEGEAPDGKAFSWHSALWDGGKKYIPGVGVREFGLKHELAKIKEKFNPEGAIADKIDAKLEGAEDNYRNQAGQMAKLIAEFQKASKADETAMERLRAKLDAVNNAAADSPGAAKKMAAIQAEIAMAQARIDERNAALQRAELNRDLFNESLKRAQADVKNAEEIKARAIEEYYARKLREAEEKERERIRDEISEKLGTDYLRGRSTEVTIPVVQVGRTGI